jgi:hypothetical protein
MCKDDREIFVGGYWDPPVHNMGSCSRPGEDPNAWKPFGPKHLGTSAVPSTVGRGGALFCFRYYGPVGTRTALLAHAGLAP